MNVSDRAEKLRRLVQFDVESAGAYEAAARQAGSWVVRSAFQQFCRDHLEHLQELNLLLVALGGQAVPYARASGDLLLGALLEALAAGGDEGILDAMAANEQLTEELYRHALNHEWRPDERAVLERNLANERRQLAWIEEALRSRVWEQEVGLSQ